MMRRLGLIVMLLTGLSATGCSSDDEPSDDTTADAATNTDTNSANEACEDVQGNYSLAPDASNPNQCPDETWTCSIIQEGDAININCGGDNDRSCTLVDCDCEFSMVSGRGDSVDVTLDFTDGELFFEDDGVLCEYQTSD